MSWPMQHPVPLFIVCMSGGHFLDANMKGFGAKKDAARRPWNMCSYGSTCHIPCCAPRQELANNSLLRRRAMLMPLSDVLGQPCPVYLWLGPVFMTCEWYHHVALSPGA